MLTERNSYYAKPGMREEVIAVRRRACAVRQSLGLPAGRILLVEGEADGPDVRWECTFASEDAHRRDSAARDASAEFGKVRAAMRAAIRRFERHIERPLAFHANGMREVALDGHPVVPRVCTFRSGRLELRGFLHLPPGTGPFPCMITNHGSTIEPGTLDVSRPGTAALLMSWGVASFLPHRRGYGDSPGRPWRADVTSAFGSAGYDAQLAERLDHESDDVLAAREHVAALPEIDAAHVGVMGSSFGGTNTLLAASKSRDVRCAVEFAGAAMNWDRTPRLRELMLDAAARVACPIFFIQAQNDYSIRPTRELAASLEGSGRIVQSRIYPEWGINPMEGHLLERDGAIVWKDDVRAFLERWL